MCAAQSHLKQKCDFGIEQLESLFVLQVKRKMVYFRNMLGQEQGGILIICSIALMVEFCWTGTVPPDTTTTDNCNPSPCQNGGTCSSSGSGYTCACVAGYDGTECDNNIDECSSNPCQNGGTCSDGVNQYTCSCASGYMGATCDTSSGGQDECSSNPCQNGGTCTDGDNQYTCSCASGFEGVTCDKESHGQAIFPPTAGCLLILCAVSKFISTVF